MKQRLLLCVSLAAFAAIGCQRPMFPAASNSTQPWLGFRGDPSTAFQRLPNGQVQYTAQQQAEEITRLSTQLTELNQRLGRFDSDNQGLHTQVATLQQQLETARLFNGQLRQQLADSVQQIEQLQSAAARPAATPPGATPFQVAGAVTVRADQRLAQQIAPLQQSGFQARTEGDTLRIEFPSDTLFTLGTYQVQSAGQSQLATLATVIRQQFPRNPVAIEAHWDQSPIPGADPSPQQLTATQALSVFNQLVRAGVPANQMFISGLGAHRPRYPNGSSQNRRIEVVISPEFSLGN